MVLVLEDFLADVKNCRLQGYDSITGINPVAWQKMQALVEHVIKLEQRVKELEKNG